METTGVGSFLMRGHVGSPWSSVSGGGGGGGLSASSPSRYIDPPPYLDFDALQVALTRLDHSPQKGKGCVGRSGAHSHRRPPSRGSRRSSADSLHLLGDQQVLDDDDDDPEPLPAPRVVNIEVKLENPTKEQPTRHRTFEGKEQKCSAPRDAPRQHDSRQELRRRLLQGCSRRTPSGGSNPHLSSATSEAEEAFRRIKEEVARLAAKRKSSSDLSDPRVHSDLSDPRVHSDLSDPRVHSDLSDPRVHSDLSDPRAHSDPVWSCDDSVGDSASVVLGRSREEQRSSSEADVVISDRESVADSGLVSRRTVITISSKKSKSASSLASSQDSAPLWLRDQQTRRSLRGCQPLEEGISVSIVSRDATSRMYVRQSDAEDRPSRASAFNVRRTIEKRQIQQERRERRALRERIREQLRSLSEGRPRRDSSGSQGSSLLLSESSVRSKSMSSLDQDNEDERSESPLVKVQSSPTLEREKEAVLTYLYGVSNLAEEECLLRPSPPTTTCPEPREAPEGECSDSWQWSRSWDSLRPGCEAPPSRVSATQSVDSVKTFEFGRCGTRRPIDAPQSFHPQESFCEPPSTSGHISPSVDLTARREPPQGREDPPPGPQPVPPPRRNKLSLSTGHIKLAEEEQPHWVRLAKERRSLRAARQVDQLSDRASTASREPEWVARARKKLESLNVTLTATTDVSCASSCVTESSSAWSRGGLDALDDLREETSRIGQDLAEEAAERVSKELGMTRDSSRMLEAPTDPPARDTSLERHKVSFDATVTEASDGDSTSRKLRSRRPQREEVRFGDLKHDWGGAKTKAAKTVNGKQKEMRFGEIQVKETMEEVETGEPRSPALKPHTNSQPTDAEGKRPVMRFGDTPLNLFPAAVPRGTQSSSKFESVAGPDPTKMTAEQLNQNVEEYDFPIPTGQEDASELLRFLEESLKKEEEVPEVVSVEEARPRPKGILKRRSVENVVQEVRHEAVCDGHQKVQHHRKSPSFDWDCVGKAGDTPPTTLTAPTTPNPTTPTTTFTTIFTTTLTAPTLPSHAAPTAPATNGHFFNVKLRHVSPNARDHNDHHQNTFTNNDPRRFHSEHSLHRRPSATLTPTQGHGGPLQGLVKARERKSVDEQDQEEKEIEAERPGMRDLLPPPAWATCRAGRGLTSSGATTGPLPDVQGKDGLPQDNPPSSPVSLSRPRPGHPTSTPTQQEPPPSRRLDHTALCTASPQLTPASALPPSLTLHTEQPQGVVEDEGGAPTPTHSSTLLTHSAYSAAFHPLAPPVPPIPAKAPDSPAPSTPPQHSHTTTTSPKAARIHQESVLSTHHLRSSTHSPAPSASQPIQVFRLTGQSGPLSSVESCPRVLQEDSVTRPPRRKEEEEESHRARRSTHQVTTTTTEDRRTREVPISVEEEVKRSARPATDPVPESSKRVSRGAEECSRAPASPIKPSRGRPAGESQAPRLVQVEVVDEEVRRAGPRKREDRRGSGLLEWEAQQRQRLEEEERNRLNIGLSLRPVSCRIKELVKMHGAFMSRFTRDKKTDINGTVDGADDILFQKIPQDPSTRSQVPQVTQAPTPTMKSPFMVKKVQSPAQDSEPPRPTRRDHPRRRSPARRSSPATQRTTSSSRVTSPSTRKISPGSRRKSPALRGTSPSTRRTSPGLRRKSPAPRGTSPSIRRRSPGPRGTSPSTRRTSPIPRRSSSSTLRSTSSRRSPSGHRGSSEGRRTAPSHRVLTESNRQPSPTREATDSLRHKLRSSLSPASRRRHPSASPNRKSSASRFKEAIPKASQIVAELRRTAQLPATPQDSYSSLGLSSKSANCTSPSATERRPEVEAGARQPRSSDSLSPTRKDCAGRGSLKDPKARQEWLTKMLTTLTHQPTTTSITSPTLSSVATTSPITASPSHTTRSTISFTPASPAHVSPTQHSVKQGQTDTPHTPSRTASTTYAHVGALHSLGGGTRSTMEEVTPVAPARKSTLSSLRTPFTPTTTSSSSFSSSKTVSSTFTASLTPTASPLPTHCTPHPAHTKNFSSPSPASLTTAHSEDILKTFVKRSPSQESLDHSKRGPVSLSSILSDSSRSSSRCSSPHASPRPSPERILKRDSFDLAARLGVIQETGSPGQRRTRGPQEDQKENIAPLLKDDSEDDTPSLSVPFRTSFRLRERSEERRKGGRKCGEDYRSRDSGLSWSPSLAAPSITLRALADTPPRHHTDSTWPPARTEASTKSLATGDMPGLSRNTRERASLRGQALGTDYGDRKPSVSPEPVSGLEKLSHRAGDPVSLSTILSCGEGGLTNPRESSPTYNFSPKLSFSEELTHLSHRYRRDVAASHTSKETSPATLTTPPASVNNEARTTHSKSRQRVKQPSESKTPVAQRRSKEGSPAPTTAPKPSPSNARNKVVRRNSSLKRNRPEDSRASLRAKKERKNSEEDAHETVVEGSQGTTRTRTTVKRTRLPATDKARPVARSGSGRVKRERSFRSSASRALEDWAVSTSSSVQGHLVKKEGQRFSHNTEEEERAGRRVARSVARRVVRRGSRTLSGGGELLTETKETSSSGVAKEDQKASKKESVKENEAQNTRKENETKENGEVEGGTVVEGSKDNGLSRKMKTSTDGERYMTHSITDKDGAKTFTTEGVNNKTTSSVEVIGAKDFDAHRAVKGTTGERVVVERTKDPLGRPSTVVKKVTSQSRLVITKTKRKTPVVV